MDYQIIVKYIRGLATDEETRSVMEWCHADESHLRELADLRRMHDALLWSDADSGSGERERPAFLRWIAAAAAVAVMAVVAAWGALAYSQRHDRGLVAMDVPAAQQASLTLPDGTRVWVMANSHLSYPASFSSTNREVSLDGEAYFQVTHDPAHPFLVRTGHYQLKVVGTEFNVSAYSRSRDWEVVLLKGRVDVLSKDGSKNLLRLKPNNRAYEGDGGLRMDPVPAEDRCSWRDGYISFSNATLGEIIDRLSLYYDVRFDVRRPQILNSRYTSKFRTRDGLEHILHVLHLGDTFRYRIDSEKNVVYVY